MHGLKCVNFLKYSFAQALQNIQGLNGPPHDQLGEGWSYLRRAATRFYVSYRFCLIVETHLENLSDASLFR
jgi:hypothetical protein